MTDQELIEQPHLLHEDGPCHIWDGPYLGGGCWSLTYSHGIIELSYGVAIHGDWDQDETPNCPECGSNILIEWGNQLIEPWEWFKATAATS